MTTESASVVVTTREVPVMTDSRVEYEPPIDTPGSYVLVVTIRDCDDKPT